MRVLTKPGCNIATEIFLDFRSTDKDFPAMHKAALDILDDDAGRHPGGTIGEDAVAEQGGASVRSFESDVENIVSRAQAAGIPDQDLAEVLQMYAANLGGNF